MSSQFSLLIIFLEILRFSRITVQAVCSSGTLPALGNTNSGPLATGTEGYLLLWNGENSQVTCYGTIENWTLNVSSAGCEDLAFQVWRPESGNYILVGENNINLASLTVCTPPVNLMTIDIPAQYQIPVQPNDVTGWRFQSALTLSQSSPFTYATYGGYLLRQDAGSSCTFPPAAGDTCSWTSAATSNKVFSISYLKGVANSPYFVNLPTSPVVSISVNDQTPVGILMYSVNASFEYNAQDVVNPPLVYTISGCKGACSIDPYTGDIVLNSPISASCQLSVSVTPEGWPTTTSKNSSLGITFDPTFDPTLVMDNPPDTVSINTAITSDSTSGYVFHTASFTCEPSASSSDCSNQQCYLVTSEPSFPPFGVKNGTFESYLTRTVSNWQSPETYNSGIACSCDHSITAPEDLVVTFINMREPPVSDLPFSVTIPEQPTPTGVIATVKGEYMPPVSTDSRTTNVDYKITMIYPQAYYGDFVIGSSLGDVTYIGTGFDYFTTPTYNIEIVAYDGDNFQSAAPANLTIDLTWVDQPPSFLVSAYSSTIPEKSAIGTALPDVILDANDRDIQGGDWITYTLVDQGTPPLGAFMFTVSNVTSKVNVDGMISIDTPGVATITYNMEIHVYDSYGETSTAPATLTVTVYDINDHPPVFNPVSYNGSVTESDIGPTYVTTVTATDTDAGENAAFVYSIQEKIANLYFDVNATSGVINLIQPIYYCEYPRMTFTVLATDQASPPLTGSAIVTVSVIPVNDHQPVFDPVYYSTEARSDLPVGETVLFVSATDLDAGCVFTPTYYFLVIQYDFDLVVQTGNITVAQPLKCWVSYDLYVNAENSLHPNQHSNPAYVRIDTYDAGETLFDIYLNIPLEDFLPKQELFMIQLNVLLAPWTVKMENVLLDGDQTVVTCYAMSVDPPPHDQYTPKKFVSANDAMKRLRVNIEGEPNDGLRGPPFAEFEPVLVVITYPDWLTATAPGIATLVILCLLLVIAIILLMLLCKKKKWLCFRKRTETRLTPLPEPRPENGDFKLHYGTTPVKKSNYSGPLIPRNPPSTTGTGNTVLNVTSPGTAEASEI